MSPTIDEEYEQLIKGHDTRLWAKLEIQVTRFKRRLARAPQGDVQGSPSESFNPSLYGRVMAQRELMRRRGEL